jgi:hypothetical protein
MAVIAVAISPRHTDRVGKVLIATEGKLFLHTYVKIFKRRNYI